MLKDLQVVAILPAANLERAKNFYMNKLGLPEPKEVAPATIQFKSGKGTSLIIYQREAGTKADHTVAGWLSEDIESTVEELREKGIAFEQYDMPNLKTDKRGIAKLGRAKSAWFKDTEGNILAITESAD